MFLYNTGARATEVIGLTVEQLVLTSSPLRQVDVCVDLTTACSGHDNPAQAHRGPARRDPDHRLEGPDALVRSIPAYACCRKIDKIVTVAIARELAAFVWAIATTVPVSAEAMA